MAGSLRRRPELVQRAAGWLSAMGEVRPMATTAPETAGHLAEQAVANGATTVVVFGGDGTINEVANGLIGTKVPLAILPGGTANVLCMEVGLGANPERAAKMLVNESEPVRIAVGQMTRPDGFSRYFLVMAGIGLDAIVVNEVNPLLKKHLGKVAYWVGGFAIVARTLPQFDFGHSGGSTRRSFVLASRVRNYGGDLEIAKQVSLLEPCFETVAFEGVNSFRYIPYLAGVIAGQVGKIPGVSVAAATHLTCAPSNGDRVPVQLDGELAGHLPAEFRTVPDALTMLVPSKYVARAKEQPWTTSHTH